MALDNKPIAFQKYVWQYFVKFIEILIVIFEAPNQ